MKTCSVYKKTDPLENRYFSYKYKNINVTIT